jgi:hypothetical protein
MLILLCMSGCIEKAPQLSQIASYQPDERGPGELPTRLWMDFDTQISNNLFCVRGNVVLTSTNSLPYLLLNATLCQGSQVIKSTKYLMLQVEPDKDYSFEISKNMKILPGSYNCTLEVIGPKGPMAQETRKCMLAEPIMNSISLAYPVLPDELAIKTAEQDYQEENIQRKAKQEAARKDSNQEKEMTKEKAIQEKGTSDVSTDETKQEIEAEAARISSSENITAKNDLQAHVDKGRINGTSQSRESLKKSMPSPKESEIELVGSSTSKKYHLPACRFAVRIKSGNKISFESIEDAKKQGYLPCKVCNP